MIALEILLMIVLFCLILILWHILCFQPIKLIERLPSDHCVLIFFGTNITPVLYGDDRPVTMKRL